VYSSMRLGVPFIAPRQLGAVESISRRQFLPSVTWCTGQSGAPPDIVRCGSPSLFGEADRWHLGAVGAPDSPVPPSDRWHLPRVTRGFRGRPLARPTVGSPDSPVNFSRTPPTKSREQLVDGCQPGAPDTVRCTTGQSGASRLSRLLAASSHSFSIAFSLILNT
jgi:hypothetical protein